MSITGESQQLPDVRARARSGGGLAVCKYCEPDEAGNMKWLREEPDNSAWLEESSNEWGIVANVTMRCCGTDCTTETYVRVNNCPMCGRELGVKVDG